MKPVILMDGNRNHSLADCTVFYVISRKAENFFYTIFVTEEDIQGPFDRLIFALKIGWEGIVVGSSR